VRELGLALNHFFAMATKESFTFIRHLMGKKKCLEAKLEISEEGKCASESKAKIEDDKECATEENRSICLQLEEQKGDSGHEIDHTESLYKYETLLQECSDLRAAKESNEVQLQETKRTLEAKYTELNEAKTQVEHEKHRRKGLKSRYKAELERVTSANKALASANKAVDSANKALIQKMMVLKGRKDRLAADYERMVANLENDVKIRDKENHALTEEYQRICVQHKETSGHEINHIQSQLQEHKEQLKSSIESYQHEKLRVANLRKELAQVHDEKKVLQDNIQSQLQEHKEQLKSSIESYQHEKLRVANLRKELAQVHDEKKVLQDKICEQDLVARVFFKQNRELEAQLSQSETKAEEYSRKLVNTEAEQERVKLAYKDLLEEVSDLKDKKECLIADLELALSESKAKVQYDLNQMVENIEQALAGSNGTSNTTKRSCTRATAAAADDNKTTSGHDVLLEETARTKRKTRGWSPQPQGPQRVVSSASRVTISTSTVTKTNQEVTSLQKEQVTAASDRPRRSVKKPDFYQNKYT
jgi:chromosome segregation ATPase